MSDPVTSMDVEDVLSSIRRLVSEEAKNAGSRDGTGAHADIHEAAENAADQAFKDANRIGDGEEAPEGVPPSNEISEDGSGAPQKLVLTAALRVADTEPTCDADSDTRPERSARRERAHLRSVSTDDTAETLGGFTRHLSSVFDRTSEDFLFDRARRAMEGGFDDDAMAKGVVQSDVSDHAEAVSQPETADEPDHIQSSPFSDLGRILKNQEADTVTDETEQHDAGQLHSEVDDQSTASMAHDTTLTEDATNAAAESPEGNDQEISDQDFHEDQGHEHVSQGQDAHDHAHTDEFDGQADDHDENQQHGEDQHHQDDQPKPVDAEPEAVNLVEETILDEETLREMVSDMVREELQGELGDRITRNVRKLVRREIQRALASREFE